MISHAHPVPINCPVARLRCVWSVTGKVDHPLACKWIPGEPPRYRSTCARVSGSSVIALNPDQFGI